MRFGAGSLALILILVLSAGAPALAQNVAAPAVDPIGALLAQAPPPDEEAAATGAAPVQAPPAGAPVTVTPEAPRPYIPPQDGALSGVAYDSRIRASMVSAQGFQGPLDGGWTLTSPEGPLYAFQLVDRGTGAVEGAWRDLRRPGALDASGFVDAVEQLGGEVVLRFDGGRVATLRSGGDGRWSGELDEAGARRAVTLARAP
ncbi:hypothetical protein [Phenylobacterium sp.]|uniref:hypothetical protein n=1 Tax=Phenylobacterium sp. TaxID=1871053 RepID=UPI003921FE76